MKTNVTVWLISVAQFAMSDRYLYSDVRRHDSYEKALNDFQSTQQWLIEYAAIPEKEDGSFEGRRFDVEHREDIHNDESALMIATVKRKSDEPGEVFSGEVRMIKKEFELDVPIILGLEDIKQIRIIIKDETER